MDDSPVDAAEVMTEQRALAQLPVVLALAEAGKLRVSAATRKPSAATVKLLAENLPGGDFYASEAISAFAWPLLLQAGGLADGPRMQLTPRGRAALRKDPALTVKLLWERWLKAGIIDEFSRVDGIKGQRASNVLSALRPRRQLAAEGLSLLGTDEWTATDDLFTQMQHEGMDPVIQRSDMRLWKLYIVDPEYGSIGYDGMHDWDVLQGRYVLALFFEYAATLGLIDVRYTSPVGARGDYADRWGGDFLPSLSRYDGLLAVRLTPLGRLCTG
ncbi:hypothetical protein [Arthrobacter dokdonensis]|uniref:hypothetical protein n=1 Tax=Arthrobacter dokdonellae TaxID=2211210 RepID=UPI000DE59D1E|nr:hypothetical protein [Arthrobacter dokdonellae]